MSLLKSVVSNVEKILFWPTELYFFKNENIDNDKIKEIILKKEKTESSRSISNKDGWQSQDSLLKEKDFSKITDFLYDCTSFIVEDIYKNDVKFFMISSWANVNRKGDYNERHIHGYSHWSCVYYVTGTYTSPIFFIDPRVRAEMYSSTFMKNNKYHNIVGPEKCEPGQVLFFPSWLEHGVPKNSTDNPRISISCNFVLK